MRTIFRFSLLALLLSLFACEADPHTAFKQQYQRFEHLKSNDQLRDCTSVGNVRGHLSQTTPEEIVQYVIWQNEELFEVEWDKADFEKRMLKWIRQVALHGYTFPSQEEIQEEDAASFFKGDNGDNNPSFTYKTDAFTAFYHLKICLEDLIEMTHLKADELAIQGDRQGLRLRNSYVYAGGVMIEMEMVREKGFFFKQIKRDYYVGNVPDTIALFRLEGWN